MLAEVKLLFPTASGWLLSGAAEAVKEKGEGVIAGAAVEAGLDLAAGGVQ